MVGDGPGAEIAALGQRPGGARVRTGSARGWCGASAEVSEGFRIALSAMLGARLRSFLTTLGIVIGVMTVIAIVAIIQGLNASFTAQIGNLGANTLYVSKFAWFAQGRGEWWAMRNRKDVGRPELEAIERDAGHAIAIAPQVGTRGTVTRLEREVSSVQVIGTNARYLDTGGGSVTVGRFLSDTDVDLSRNAVVLGYAVAERLFAGFPADAVMGKRVMVEGRPFTVIGTMAKRGQMLGMDMDSNVLLPYTTVLRDLGSRRSINIAVAADPEHLDALEDQLVGHPPARAAGPPGQAGRLRHQPAGAGAPDLPAAHRRALRRGHRGRAHHAGGGRHRDHEHHAGVGDRADPRDRRPPRAGRAPAHHPAPVPDRVVAGRGAGRRRRHRARARRRPGWWRW